MGEFPFTHGQTRWNFALRVIRQEIGVREKRDKKGCLSGGNKGFFEHFTTYKISNEEASMIYRSMQPECIVYHGDYTIQPEATMGKILAHSLYEKI